MCWPQLVPPIGMLNNPMNAVTTKFVRTSTNKVKCPVFVIRVSRRITSWSATQVPNSHLSDHVTHCFLCSAVDA